MKTAARLGRIPPYLFMELRTKISRAREQGVDVISLAIGDPVEPTPAEIVEELARAARDPANHRYPTDEEKGMLSFREAVARWYARRYGVKLDPEREIITLIGSKEGCHHFALARVDPGDVVLVTDPGYPAYRASVWLAGGEPVSVPIRPQDGYLPDFAEIPTDVARRATAMFLNYPNNPTGATADRAFLERLVEFARSFDLAVCYDNPYIDLVFDGAEPLSFLGVPGAREVGIELNSLSKPFNMTGWRIGMAVGNPELIAAIAKVKENTDSGVFNAIQYAGIVALDQCEDHIDFMRRTYRRRRKLVVATLQQLGLEHYPARGTFYLWVPVPAGHTSLSFTDLLFEKAQVVVAPGPGYGAHGEGFVRFSLTVPDERLEEAMERLLRALS